MEMPDSADVLETPEAPEAQPYVNTEPTDPQFIARVGHAFYDWAADLYTSGQMGGATQLFEHAVYYYERTLELAPDDAVVLGDRAFALHWMGREEAAEALRTFIEVAGEREDLAVQVENAKRLLAEQ